VKMSDDGSLAAYVDALTNAYLQLRQRVQPSQVSVPAEVVEPVAKVLLDRKADPYAFVAFAYDRCFLHTINVYPNMVFSLMVVQLFFEEAPQREDEIALVLKLQAQYVQDRLDNGEHLKDILSDRLFPLSSVFRFASAWSSGNKELAAIFEKDARRMLLFEPLYKKYLGALLPEEMLR
jgi:hypothetical protein